MGPGWWRGVAYHLRKSWVLAPDSRLQRSITGKRGGLLSIGLPRSRPASPGGVAEGEVALVSVGQAAVVPQISQVITISEV